MRTRPSNDPDEHEKAIKYTDIIANSVMLQNVVDMSDIILQLIAEGYPVTRNELKCTSPP